MIPLEGNAIMRNKGNCSSCSGYSGLDDHLRRVVKTARRVGRCIRLNFKQSFESLVTLSFKGILRKIGHNRVGMFLPRSIGSRVPPDNIFGTSHTVVRFWACMYPPEAPCSLNRADLGSCHEFAWCRDSCIYSLQVLYIMKQTYKVQGLKNDMY